MRLEGKGITKRWEVRDSRKGDDESEYGKGERKESPEMRGEGELA